MSLALLGVLGHVGANRRDVADGMLATAESRIEVAQTQITKITGELRLEESQRLAGMPATA